MCQNSFEHTVHLRVMQVFLQKVKRQVGQLVPGSRGYAAPGLGQLLGKDRQHFLAKLGLEAGGIEVDQAAVKGHPAAPGAHTGWVPRLRWAAAATSARRRSVSAASTSCPRAARR